MSRQILKISPNLAQSNIQGLKSKRLLVKNEIRPEMLKGLDGEVVRWLTSVCGNLEKKQKTGR